MLTTYRPDCFIAFIFLSGKKFLYSDSQRRDKHNDHLLRTKWTSLQTSPVMTNISASLRTKWSNLCLHMHHAWII